MVKDFPLSPLERVARKAGGERVSASAVRELYKTLMDLTEKIAVDAITLSRHAHRVTIKREDIILASK